MRRAVLAAAALAAAAGLAGCGAEGTTRPLPVAVVGKQLYAQNGCGGCHMFTPAGSNGKVGPDLDHLAADAQKANQGPLDQYTFESIKNPNGYVVPGFKAGVMP